MVVCHESKVQLLFKQAKSCETLRTIIKMNGVITDEEKQRSKDTGITIHSIEEVLVSFTPSL